MAIPIMIFETTMGSAAEERTLLSLKFIQFDAASRGGLNHAFSFNGKSMAIVILGEALCPLCGHVTSDGHEVIATPNFIEIRSHPLWRYSDAAMHYECFQAWRHREDFVAEYNKTIGRIVWGDGNQHQMLPDGIIIVAPVSGNNRPDAQ